jgi:hypothetical protein
MIPDRDVHRSGAARIDGGHGHRAFAETGYKTCAERLRWRREARHSDEQLPIDYGIWQSALAKTGVRRFDRKKRIVQQEQPIDSLTCIEQ